MPDCLIAFGSNQGDGRRTYADIQIAFRSDPRMGDVRASRLHSTKAIGGGEPGHAKFLNGVIRVTTSLVPEDLLRWLIDLERSFGRKPGKRWSRRAVDLDLLLYDREHGRREVDPTHNLTIPHPRMTFRRFVLVPAAEIAADMFHPLARMAIGQLLHHLNTAPNVVAIIGETRHLRDMTDALKSRQHASPYSAVFPTEIVPADYPAIGIRFAIVPIDSKERWLKTRDVIKLIVFWQVDRSASYTAFVGPIADEWIGPRLELESADMEDEVVEIEAALAAMLAESVD